MKILFLLFFAFIQLFTQVNAYELVNKEKLIYEIQEAVLNEEGISLSGWSFIGESQHFNNRNDFDGYFIIDNGKHILKYPLNFHKKEMTNLMKMGNPRRCGDNEFNMKARDCYYDFSMVGWNVFIPITDLMDNTKYTARIHMKALKSGQDYQTYALFSNEFQVIEDKPRNRIVSLNSGIQNTRIVVNHDYVMVREKPSKTSNIYNSSNSCSLTFGSVLYFIKYTEYLRVKNYVNIDDVTWYQVGVEEIGCFDSKASVIEGNRLAWIPSTYVNYNGTIATIEIRNTYTKPIIYLENQTVYVGDTSFNPDLYVSAYDYYDGIIVPKRTRSNLNILVPGRYYVQYSATNSKNKTTTKMMYVDVIEKKINTPPIITAYDQSIYQNSTYNPLQNVSAYDLEDGDITNKIKLTTFIDSKIVGTHEQCYYVEDKEGLSNDKCVNITVLPRIIPPIYQNSNLRFIDSKNPFYKEPVPNKWKELINMLITYANSTTTIMKSYY